MSRTLSITACGVVLLMMAPNISHAQPKTVGAPRTETIKREADDKNARVAREQRLSTMYRILQLPTVAAQQASTNAEWHPRNNSIFFDGYRPTIWNVIDPGPTINARGQLPWRGRPLAWSPDGALFALQSPHNPQALMDTLLLARVVLSDQPDCLFCIVPEGGPEQRPRAIITNDPLKKLSAIIRAVFSPDNTKLAVLDAAATVAVFNVATLSEAARFTRGFDPPDAKGVAVESIPIFFDWSRNNTLLVGIARESSPGNRTAVRIRQLDHGDKLRTAFIEANARTTSATYNSNDPTQILLAANDLTILNADTRETVRTIPVGQTIRHAEWRPDGSMILTVAEGNILQIWNATTGALSRSGDAVAAAWSPDGTKMAVARLGSVTIQTASNGTVLQTLLVNEDDLPARSFRWRPSGNGLAGQVRQKVVIWRVD